MEKRTRRQKIRKDEIAQTLERLRALTDGIDQAIYVIDPRTRKILFANMKTEELYGGKVIGKRCFKVFQKLDKPCLRCNNRHIFGKNLGKTYVSDHQSRRDQRWYRGMYKAIMWPNGKYVKYGINIDITDQRKMEQNLTESEARYRSLFEDSPISLWEMDFSEVKKFIENLGYSKVRDFKKYLENNPDVVKKCAALIKLIDVNKATLDLFKAEDKEQLRNGLGRIFREETFDSLKKEFIAVIEGKTRYETQSIVQTLKGDKKRIFLRWSAAPNHADTLSKVIVSIVDITQEKEVEEALRQSELLFRSTIENSHDTIVIIDENFKIIYANTEATHLTGYPKEEIRGQDFRKFLDGNCREFVENIYMNRIRGEKVVPQYEFIIVRKDGEKRYVEVKSACIKEPHGKALVMGQVRDITDLKKIEDERRHFEERLSALNKYGQSLNIAKTMKEISKLTLDGMEKTLGYKYASIFIMEGKNLRLLAHRGYSKDLALKLPLNGDKGISLKAIKRAKPFYVPDTSKDKEYIGVAEGIRSELAVPIKIGNKVLGVLNAESKELAAFDEQDRKLLEILASHIAIAITNLKGREQLKKLSKRLEYLMKSSATVMNVKNAHNRLKTIAKVIQKFGWRRVVISLRDENLEAIDLVTAGLTEAEVKLLMERKAPSNVWKARLGPKFERFKIGEFYYLLWNDPWILENVHGITPGTAYDEATTTYAGLPSKRPPEEMVDWHPQDMLYAPLRTPEGKILGTLSMDDPVDGQKPTKDSLEPLELFLSQAAILIEKAQLTQGLKNARKQLEVYAARLEQKVDERTRELKTSQKELLKAQRLATIGELAGMVGHDLRNPLTSISASTYFVKKRLGSTSDNKVREMIELIEKNISYSNKIINDLLDYSKELKLDLTETDPESLVKEALSRLEIPPNVHVLSLTGKEPRIKVDVEKIERAFMNIIKNAFEAMLEDGLLTIKCRRVKDEVTFSFSDSGAGMPKHILKKLWVPLFTTKAKGMGFGLPICKRIIETHGGSISVSSTIGKGTTFTITLPIEPKIEGGEKVWIRPLESSSLTMTRI